VTGGKPIATQSQSTSGISAINLLVAFYDIHGRKGEVLLYGTILFIRLLKTAIIVHILKSRYNDVYAQKKLCRSPCVRALKVNYHQ
jgi:hypothetical protein